MHLRCRTGPSVQQGAATLLDLPMLGACVVSAGIEGVLAEHAIARHHGTTIDGFHACRCACGVEFDCPIFGGWAICEDRHRAHVAAAIREHLLSDDVVERATRAADKAERQAFIDGARGQALIAVGTRAALSAVLEEDR